MEKYSQFRDKGSGISPFLPIPLEERPRLLLPLYALLFAVRVPVIIFLGLSYLLFLQWLPIGSLGKKLILWCILGTPGIWWVDLQIDGVRRGSLGAKVNKRRLPAPGTVLASSHTSPLDCLYLAAIFDPIFTASYPGTRQVVRISLLQAIIRSLSYPQTEPPPSAQLTTLDQLVRDNPGACVLVFPECTTTNGRGILPLSPSLLSLDRRTKIFPVSLRYTPADITTPVPGTGLSFLWNLCSKPTNCIRVRIASAVHNVSTGAAPSTTSGPTSSTSGSGSGTGSGSDGDSEEDEDEEDDEVVLLRERTTRHNTEPHEGRHGRPTAADERRVLESIGEALARLGRVKRVDLGVRDKQRFVATWSKNRRIW